MSVLLLPNKKGKSKTKKGNEQILGAFCNKIRNILQKSEKSRKKIWRFQEKSVPLHSQ